MSVTVLPLPPDAPATADERGAPPALAHPAYRPDIDGLRAIAIGSVVAYHYFPARLPGGFVGVDIFFVISGYLISTILYGSLARGSFDLATFYARRVRRIFPALALVLASTFAFGWWALMADEYRELGKHVAGGAGFVANLVLWSESGYFDAAAEAKPLLHLWSLGIEEQFYIVWPLLIALFWRLRVDQRFLLAVTAGLSFALDLHLAATDPVADFYSPAARFWELALGASLAWFTLHGRAAWTRPSARQANARAFVGLLLLAVGALTITAASAFPGWLALLPTLGAFLVIAAGPQAWPNRRVLSHRLMVWIGLVSFPLYLWHWPIASFMHIVFEERPTRTARFLAIGASILLAWLTYRCVEGPVRRRPGSRAMVAGLLCVMVVIATIGYACFRDGGFPFRRVASVAIVNRGDVGQDEFHHYMATHFAPCTPLAVREQAETWRGTTRCFQSRPGTPQLAIVGDSHAEHLFIGVAEALPRTNVVYYARSSLPVVGNPQFDVIFRAIVDDPQIDTVILSALWALRLDEPVAHHDAEAALHRTVALLADAGKTVIITDDTPNFSFSALRCKYDSSLLRKHRCTDDIRFYQHQLDGYAAMLDSLARDRPRVKVVRTSRYFCDTRACTMAKDGELMYRESNHLNINGSRYAGRRLVQELTP